MSLTRKLEQHYFGRSLWQAHNKRVLQSIGFGFLGVFLTLPAIAIWGPMGSAAVGWLLLGLSAGCYILGLGIHALQMRLRGKELVRKLEVLLDAQPVDPG